MSLLAPPCDEGFAPIPLSIIPPLVPHPPRLPRHSSCDTEQSVSPTYDDDSIQFFEPFPPSPGLTLTVHDSHTHSSPTTTLPPTGSAHTTASLHSSHFTFPFSTQSPSIIYRPHIHPPHANTFPLPPHTCTPTPRTSSPKPQSQSPPPNNASCMSRCTWTGQARWPRATHVPYSSYTLHFLVYWPTAAPFALPLSPILPISSSDSPPSILPCTPHLIHMHSHVYTRPISSFHKEVLTVLSCNSRNSTSS